MRGLRVEVWPSIKELEQQLLAWRKNVALNWLAQEDAAMRGQLCSSTVAPEGSGVPLEAVAE